jgi:macrolide transport system ATP-binding/permease protein
MGVLGRFFRKLGILFRRERFDRELGEEMAFHRAQRERELIEGGLDAQQARFAAMREFGNETRLKEQSHEATGFAAESVRQDLRFAVRQLVKNPGFAVTAVVVLALGIGASVAIFSFVDAALIKPLPYKEPSRLMQLFESIQLGPRFHLSYLDYLDWKRENTVFESLDIFSPNNSFLLDTPTGRQTADGAKVSAGFFRTLGVEPVLGRDFRAEDEQESAPRTVLLSYSAWQRRYGGRRDVIGQTVVLDGSPRTIVGVLPKDFHFAPAEPVDFWSIERASGGCEKDRGCHNLFGVARLKPGVSFATAFADIKTIAEQLEKQYPDSNRGQVAYMMTLTDVIVGDIRPILLVLLGGAMLLLLIATVNVASLLLVRSETRRREMAVRSALGASGARLMRQFVTEGLTLTAGASAIGLALACLAMQLLVRLIPEDALASMPYLNGAGLNARVILFACAVSLLTSVLFSLTPALRLPASDLRDALSEGGRAAANVMWRRFGANLIVVELAMAVVLLAGAGLLGKSFYRLLHVDTGLEADHLATLQLGADGSAHSKDEQQIALGRQVLAGMSSLPGVNEAAITTRLPLGDGDGTTSFQVVGRPYYGAHNGYEVSYRQVSAGYFSTLQARLVGGRYFSEGEDKSKPLVAVINQEMARLLFHGEDAVGKRIYYDDDPKRILQIIGVVNDIQEGQLNAAPRAAIYIPFNQNPDSYFAVLVRSSQQEDSLLSAMTGVVHRIDPGIAVSEPVTMRQRIHDSPAAYLHRATAWLAGGFAGLALVLGVVGLYGVVAYSVSQRTREIGVRMALGAQRSRVYGMILREAGWLAGLGIGIGLICSVGAGMLMRSLLFGVRAWDAATLAGVTLVLAAAAVLASYLPARRAASVNPVEALRAE